MKYHVIYTVNGKVDDIEVEFDTVQQCEAWLDGFASYYEIGLSSEAVTELRMKREMRKEARMGIQCPQCLTEHEVNFSSDYDTCQECGNVFCRKCNEFVDLEDCNGVEITQSSGCVVVDYFCINCETKVFSIDL